jgi:hypothetical protein
VRVLLAASSPEEVHVVAGAINGVSPQTWYAYARRIGIAIVPHASAGGGVHGARVTAYAVDAASGAIPSAGAIGPNGAPARLAITLSGPYNASFPANIAPTAKSFEYDGVASGAEHVTVYDATSGLPSATKVVHVAGEPGLIFAANADEEIVSFASDANGDAAPVGTFDGVWGCWGAPTAGHTHEAVWIPCNIDGLATLHTADGAIVDTIVPPANYSISAMAFDAHGNRYLSEFLGGLDSGNVNCSTSYQNPKIVESSPRVGVLRTIVLPQQCVASMAVDPNDDIYVVLYAWYTSAIQIVEFGPQASGENPRPIRTITFAAGSEAGIFGFACDTQGNVYAELNHDGIIEIPPTGTTWTMRLAGPETFTLDRQNDIYAEIATGASSYAIEEYSPASIAPIRTIAGPDTGLDVPGAGIAVAPGEGWRF